MARVTYIAVTGERKTVDAQAGESVMLTAIKNEVNGDLDGLIVELPRTQR